MGFKRLDGVFKVVLVRGDGGTSIVRAVRRGQGLGIESTGQRQPLTLAKGHIYIYIHMYACLTVYFFSDTFSIRSQYNSGFQVVLLCISFMYVHIFIVFKSMLSRSILEPTVCRV